MVTADANKGNLIQERPLLKEVSTNNEKQADTFANTKNSIDNFTQLLFIQLHDDFITETNKNETPVTTIKKSVNDLLIIIINGIIDQIIIKTFSKIDFDFNIEKKLCMIFLLLKLFILQTKHYQYRYNYCREYA